MKELRGAEALRYSREAGVRFDVDDDFIREAEGEFSGGPVPMLYVQELVRERAGAEYEPTEILPGTEVFDFLVNRYGDGWIYVALEGRDPEAEEGRALRLFHTLLERPNPSPGGDVKAILGRQRRAVFLDTGYPPDADLNLLFHACVRLARKGLLVEVEDPEPVPAGRKASYGRRRFLVPADVEVSLAGVLCAVCRRRHLSSPLSLHQECARRLRKALAGGAADAKPRPR